MWIDRYELAVLMVGLAAIPTPTRAVEWRWSNPARHGNNIVSMTKQDETILQLGDRGQLYASTDLDRWIPKPTPTARSLRSAVFFKQRLVVGCEAGAILTGDEYLNLKLIDLGTANWIEGVAASPNNCVAVGDNAAIYQTTDALSWIKVPAPVANSLRSVTFGANQFVSVGERGTILVSADGLTWTRTAPNLTTNHLNNVGLINDQFYAVGDQGAVFQSGDGRNWSRVITGATNHLYAVAGNGSDILITGQNTLFLKEGSGNWVNQMGNPLASFPAPEWTYYSALWDGRLFLIGGRSGRTLEGFKPVGSSQYAWVERNESPRFWLWDTTKLGSTWISVGDQGTILTSGDTLTWNIELPPDTIRGKVLLGAGATTHMAIAVGEAGTILTTPDGANWSQQVSPTPNDLQGVCYFKGTWIASGGAGTLLTSADGTRWTSRTSQTQKFLSSVAANGDAAVAVGDDGAIVRSTTGLNWQPIPASTTNWIYRIRRLENQFVAVGENGLVMTSADGTQWVRHNSGTSRWLNDVAYAEGYYYAAGSQGTLIRSPNGIEWSASPCPTVRSIYGIAADAGRLVAVGFEGLILRARTIPDSTPLVIDSFLNNGREAGFLLIGSPDQQFELQRGRVVGEWNTGPVLEFVNGESSLTHFESLPSLPRRQEFYRGRLMP